MTVRTLLLAFIFVAGNCCATAMAQEKAPLPMSVQQPKSSGDMAAIRQKIDQEIGLTPDQKARMETIRKELEVKQKDIRRELKAKHEALRDILDSENPNRAQADAMGADINALQGAMMKNHVDFIFRVREVLTPEQYKRLESFRKSHPEGHPGNRELRGENKDRRPHDQLF